MRNDKLIDANWVVKGQKVKNQDDGSELTVIQNMVAGQYNIITGTDVNGNVRSFRAKWLVEVIK